MNPNPHLKFTGLILSTHPPAFTLIELLCVIAVMAILTVIAIPSLKALRGSALQSAVRQVSSEMSLARQYAITRNTSVRFVIALGFNPDSPNDLPNLGSNHICRAYCIVAQTYMGTNNVGKLVATNEETSLIGWLPIQDWKFLPDGVVFSEHNVTANGAGSYNTLNTDPLPPLGISDRKPGSAPNTTVTWRYFDAAFTNSNPMIFAWPDSTRTNTYVTCVEFNSSGYINNLMPDSWNFAGLRLMQGTVAEVPQPPDYTNSVKLVVTDTNNWSYIEYNQISGKVRVRNSDTYQ